MVKMGREWGRLFGTPSPKWKSHKANIIDSADCGGRNDGSVTSEGSATQFPQDILSRRNEETRRRKGIRECEIHGLFELVLGKGKIS